MNSPLLRHPGMAIAAAAVALQLVWCGLPGIDMNESAPALSMLLSDSVFMVGDSLQVTFNQPAAAGSLQISTEYRQRWWTLSMVSPHTHIQRVILPAALTDEAGETVYTIGALCRLRYFGASGDGTFESAPFSVMATPDRFDPGRLCLLYPNGGERLSIGETIEIRWIIDTAKVANGVVPQVSLDRGKTRLPFGLEATIKNGDPRYYTGWLGRLKWTIPSQMADDFGIMHSMVSDSVEFELLAPYESEYVSDASDGSFGIAQ